MSAKWAFCVLFCFVASSFLFIIAVANAKTLYVDDDGGAGVFSRIQDAVDAASPGDTIIVREGTYIENIYVGKSLRIFAEEGYEYTFVFAADSSAHIFEVKARDVSISGFTIMGAKGESAGIYIQNAENCSIYGNNISYCTYGIFLNGTRRSIISSNIINSNEYYGIFLDSSNENVIINNFASKNWDGIFLKSSYKNRIENNSAVYNNFGGISLMHSCENIIINNTAKSNFFHGLYLMSSYNNTLSMNRALLSMYYGINVLDSDWNLIYLNDFVNNRFNAKSSGSNCWNSTEKKRYAYNNSTYEDFMGNYWSDYEGNDAEGDGIGDVPYIIAISAETDNYPLMESFLRYEMQEKGQIFDCGEPKNPYPSIMGTHRGSIMPSETLTVSKICVYPCAGTCGHIEYVRIWNASLNVSARWKGYEGAWKCISFNNSFVLYAGKKYNYTIITGSYPQIHHTDRLNLDCGVITCDEFVDANGIIHKWIPAIRLE